MSNLKDIKYKIGIGTSTEYLLGIDKPPEYQCRHIDSILRELNYANDAIHKSKRYDDIEDLKECLDDIENALYNLDYDLEDIRDAIVKVRGWGEQWKQVAKDLLNDRDDLVEYLQLEEKFNV